MGIVTGVCMKYPMKQKIQRTGALFSWDCSVVYQKNKRTELFETMKNQNLNVLYQNISDTTDVPQVHDFLIDAASNDIKVWLLTGDMSWGFDASGTSMIEETERTSYYNEKLLENQKLCGIVMDCEPYLDQKWKTSSDEIMGSWVQALANGYQKAKELNLDFIICIPYYLDTVGYYDELKTMIQECCDEVAIMNYYKNHELEHVENEVELARNARKKVIVIYELQKPGIHELIDNNTYYNDGIEAVHNSWLRMVKQYGTDKLLFALHHYDALKEVINNE